MTEGQEKLAEVFNAFAAKAQEDHPQLKDRLIVLDQPSGKFFGSFERVRDIVYDDAIAQLLGQFSEAIAKGGSQAFKFMALLDGQVHHAGNVIGYKQRNWISDEFDGTATKIDDATFTLYHELGHLVVPQSYNESKNKGLRNSAETGADVYALIRLSQLYPDEAGAFFQRLRITRSLWMVEKNDVEHFSAPAIETLRQIRKETNLSQFTPAEAASLAAAIAKAHQASTETIEAVEGIFKNFRDTAVKTKNLQQALRGLAENMLAADAPVFDRAYHYFKPFFDGEISRGSFDFTGEYWDDMKKKLQARETPPPVPQLVIKRKSAGVPTPSAA